MVAAETGSGKTGAFCLPLLQVIHETLRGKGRSEVKDDATSTVRFSDPVVLNAYDRDKAVAISPDGLLCQCRQAQAWGGCRATHGAISGRYYFEARVTDDGLCRVGFSTSNAGYELGTDSFSWGFGGTGKKSFNTNFEDYGAPFGLHDVIGCYLDRDGGTISFSKNGAALGVAFLIPPELSRAPIFPAVTLKNAEMRFDFSAIPNVQGFKPWRQLSEADGVVWQSEAKQAAAKQVSPPGAVRLPVALILEPTRELAEQIYEEISKFKAQLPEPAISHLLVIGGVSSGSMAAALRAGVHIIIATPGRIIDFVKAAVCDLSALRFFVLDEADRLIQDDGGKDILAMFSKCDRAKLQVIVCSATLRSSEISQLSNQITHHAQWVDLKGKDAVPSTVDHAYVLVDPTQEYGPEDSAAYTDRVHVRDRTGSHVKTPESLSEEWSSA